jgi:hypothetical protein
LEDPSLSENVETYGVRIVPTSLFPGLQFIETRRFAGGRNVIRIGVVKFGIRNTIYSRSGGVTLAIQES